MVEVVFVQFLLLIPAEAALTREPLSTCFVTLGLIRETTQVHEKMSLCGKQICKQVNQTLTLPSLLYPIPRQWHYIPVVLLSHQFFITVCPNPDDQHCLERGLLFLDLCFKP